MFVRKLLSVSLYLMFPLTTLAGNPTGPVPAQPTQLSYAVVECNDCSIAQMRTKTFLPPPSASMPPYQDYYFVGSAIDLKNGIVRSFEHKLIWDPDIYWHVGFGSTEISPDPELVDLVGSYSYAVAPIRAKAAIEAPPAVAESAWDLSGASYRQNNVADLISTQVGSLDQASALLATLVSIANGSLDPGVQVVVKFEDGSTADFKLDEIGEGLRLEFKFREGRDIDNNTIPSDADGFKGEFSFLKGGQKALEKYIAAASRHGIAISQNGIPAGPTTVPHPNGGTITILFPQGPQSGMPGVCRSSELNVGGHVYHVNYDGC